MSLIVPLILVAVTLGMLVAFRGAAAETTVALSSFYSLRLPIQRIDNLEVLVVWVLVCLVALALHLAASQQRATFARSWVNRGAVAFALIITVRLLIDRPASARFSEVGGLGSGVEYVAAGWAFLVGISLGARHRGAVTVRAVVLVALCALGYIVYENQEVRALGALYHSPTWLLAAVCMASASRHAAKKGGLAPGLIVIALLGFLQVIATSSVHRAFAVYPLLAALSCWYVYRQVRRFVPVVFVVGAVALALLATRMERLPETIARPLSIFGLETYAESSGLEFGWTNTFRREMNARGWSSIQQAPILGSGFVIRRSDLEGAMSLNGTYGAQEALAVSRGFHNAVVSLAVSCGLPTGILWIALFVAIVWKAGREIRRAPPGSDKYFGAVILAYLLPATVQMLLNGLGFHMVRVNLALGLLAALSTRFEVARVPGQGLQARSSPERRNRVSWRGNGSRRRERVIGRP